MDGHSYIKSMTVFQALLLGLVQGLTEFLPISSSGHLVLLQRLLNVDLGGADMLFDITLHTGTLFAVCAVYYRQILGIFKRPFKRLLWLAVATVPAALAGIFLGDIVEDVFFGGAYLAAGFALSAALLAGSQIYSKRKKIALPLTLKRATVMGIAQAVAILPGLSRSGTTVAAGMLCGTEKREAADFSFLMSIPVILGGFAVTLYKGVSGGDLSTLFALSDGKLGLCVAISVAASALAGFAAIKIMLKSVSKSSYTPYIVYLCLLSAACGAMNFAGVL